MQPKRHNLVLCKMKLFSEAIFIMHNFACYVFKISFSLPKYVKANFPSFKNNLIEYLMRTVPRFSGMWEGVWKPTISRINVYIHIYMYYFNADFTENLHIIIQQWIIQTLIFQWNVHFFKVTSIKPFSFLHCN